MCKIEINGSSVFPDVPSDKYKSCKNYSSGCFINSCDYKNIIIIGKEGWRDLTRSSRAAPSSKQDYP